MTKIELLYFESCPLYKEALVNLQEVLTEASIDAPIELIHVDSPDKTEDLKFYGSPSIRIDGADLEGKTGAYTYACRRYEINGEMLGVPTKEYILERLQALSVLS